MEYWSTFTRTNWVVPDKISPKMKDVEQFRSRIAIFDYVNKCVLDKLSKNDIVFVSSALVIPSMAA